MTHSVLFVTPWFPSTPDDGRYNFIFHSVDALCTQGVKISTLVPCPYTPNIFGFFKEEWKRSRLQIEDFDTAYNLEVCQYLSLPRNYCHYLVWELYRARMAPIIEQKVRACSAQVIHVHTELAAFAVVPVAKKLGIPVVVTLHGINMAPRQLDTPKKRARLQSTLAGADRVILVGEPLRAYFAPLAGGDNNFCVVPNGFFLPIFSRAENLLQNDSPLRLISISNLQEGKGIDLNLHALALLDQCGMRDWQYTIVGGGNERPRLETIVDEHGLRDRVTFEGHLPHQDALSKLHDADVFLLPSYREAFGVAYLEAMAAGLLTIGVKGQGPDAFIEDGVSGFLVAPMNVDVIADRLEFITRNREECRRIAERGRVVVTTEFTWQRHAEKLMAVYSEVVR